MISTLAMVVATSWYLTRPPGFLALRAQGFQVLGLRSGTRERIEPSKIRNPVQEAPCRRLEGSLTGEESASWAPAFLLTLFRAPWSKALHCNQFLRFPETPTSWLGQTGLRAQHTQPHTLNPCINERRRNCFNTRRPRV